MAVSLGAYLRTPNAGPLGLRGGGARTFARSGPTPASRTPQYSSRDKKSAAGVVAGLRGQGRDVAFHTGRATPTGRSRVDFQSIRLPDRGAAPAPAPAPSPSGRRSFLGSFFRGRS